jgi:ketosteroid isomerase-like protein
VVISGIVVQDSYHMRYRHVVIAALVSLGGCAVPQIEVNSLHPAPRPLGPRAVDTVQTYKARPPGGVAVYSIEASGEDYADTEAVVRQKAASLGCDGLMFTVLLDQSKSEGEPLTGMLNQHHEYVYARVDALCVVDPAALPPGCPAPARSEPTAPAPTTAGVDAAARDALERWRQAHESRSGEALAKLYLHDASLRVVHDGSLLLGWTAFEPVLRDQLRAEPPIHLRIADVQVSSAGTTAIIVASMRRERADATPTATDDGVVTLVLRAAGTGNDAGWVIVAEHTSHRPL